MLHQSPNQDRSRANIDQANVDVPPDLFVRERIEDESLANDRPIVLDLFAGAGGLSLGFKAAGFRVVGACEIDEWACDTIRHNFPDEKVLSGDIRKLQDQEFRDQFGKVDIIVGGPPCQGFSISNIAGRRADDPRNTLFREYIRAVETLTPDIAIIENVVGLASKRTTDGTSYLTIIREELECLGYETHAEILHAQNFGVPQIRPRLIICGTKTTLKTPYPNATHYPTDEQLSLGHLDF